MFVFPFLRWLRVAYACTAPALTRPLASQGVFLKPALKRLCRARHDTHLARRISVAVQAVDRDAPPEWRGKFLHYKALKKALKECSSRGSPRACHAAGAAAADGRERQAGEGEPAAAQDDCASDANEAEAQFFELLKSELLRVNRWAGRRAKARSGNLACEREAAHHLPQAALASHPVTVASLRPPMQVFCGHSPCPGGPLPAHRDAAPLCVRRRHAAPAGRWAHTLRCAGGARLLVPQVCAGQCGEWGRLWGLEEGRAGMARLVASPHTACMLDQQLASAPLPLPAWWALLLSDAARADVLTPRCSSPPSSRRLRCARLVLGGGPWPAGWRSGVGAPATARQIATDCGCGLGRVPSRLPQVVSAKRHRQPITFLSIPSTHLPAQILKKYDKQKGGQRGRAFLQHCWRMPAGGAFLHSPLLDGAQGAVAWEAADARPQSVLARATCSS